ncbi:3-deoxy-7-phosphoheptulonate synthase class II [Rhodotorula paludigena]|uniref:3-deoxy-7-phosphoheptulonate synthase class II n=1 Tax=Rhodotorula paludigena TaxID=86838 RepID=UPI0031829996
MQSSSDWSPQSWRSKPVGQDIAYPTPSASSSSGTSANEPDPVLYKRKEGLEGVTRKLEQLPPLVSAVEIERLKANLANVATGKAFLLQGGDCAELFDYCTSEKIEHRLSLLLSMSLILIWGLKQPVVRIARMGGQYAKPRSKQTEVVDGQEIPSFRGHNVNGIDPSDRLPDPERLLSAYFHAAGTINYSRALLASGFASLPSGGNKSVPWSLPLAHVRSPELLKSYESIVQNLSEALEFMSVVGVDRGASAVGGALESADIFMSHEALMLEYEAALTRKLRVPPFAAKEEGEEGWYCTSAHTVWIGDRTRALDGAHVEFFRGLRNPVGIKVGPSMEPDELVRLLGIVDPHKEPGKVTLISRYGAELVEKKLPGHIAAVQKSGHKPIFASDPMHGNTRTSSAYPGVKTRHMHDIVSEISASLRIHQELGSRLGGVHLELTGDINDDGMSVTECLGGSMRLEEEQLALRFESYCDPRLNFEQALDIAFMLSQAGGRSGRGDSRIFEELASRPQSLDSRA